MYFKTFNDLTDCIRNNLWRIPKDIGLVVGIPRSGLLAANIIALLLNRPLTDVEGLIENRIISAGKRLGGGDSNQYIKECDRILVIDDSLATGRVMRNTRDLIENAGIEKEIIFGAVYTVKEFRNAVDIYFEICPLPRFFEWNLMHHHSVLKKACVDIDGVLCIDPTEEQNDDGPNYTNFIHDASPLFVPTVKVGALVTCRLEKYRDATVKWLLRHNIRYDHLIMWDLPDKAERLRRGGHAKFKAQAFRSFDWADLFIESSLDQAIEIVEIARKPAICIEKPMLVTPSNSSLMKGILRKTPGAIQKKTERFMHIIHQYILKLNR